MTNSENTLILGYCSLFTKTITNKIGEIYGEIHCFKRTDYFHWYKGSAFLYHCASAIFILGIILLAFGVERVILPVFPLDFLNNLSFQSFTLFKTYSLKSNLIEPVVFFILCLTVGVITLIVQGLEKGFNVLGREFIEDLFNPRRLIKFKK